MLESVVSSCTTTRFASTSPAPALMSDASGRLRFAGYRVRKVPWLGSTAARFPITAWITGLPDGMPYTPATFTSSDAPGPSSGPAQRRPDVLRVSHTLGDPTPWYW